MLRLKACSPTCTPASDNDDDEEETAVGYDADQLEAAVDDALENVDQVRIEAKDHVRKYQAQRAFKNSLSEKARDEVARNVPFKERNHCLTIDMGQNLALPNFAAEQVGDTYYLTPLTIFVFGVNDDSRPDGTSDHMNAYIWSEGVGKRGANNIASCLLKDYRKRGYFDGGHNTGSLNIIADNCGGQNKNEDVIRFHVWIVEAGWFPEVNLIFLVKGHTKNACDRMFNLLKQEYHNKNIETFNELVSILDKNKFVKVDVMLSNEFLNFSPVLNKYYRSLKSGETNRTHVFTVKNSRNPTLLLKKDDVNAEERLDNLLPTRAFRVAVHLNEEERKLAISNLLGELAPLTPPGIAPIKQCELYNKWRKLLKVQNRDLTCPKPTDEVLNSVRAERNKKRRKKSQHPVNHTS